MMEIKYGSTRTVFLIRNWAIKIPNFREWRLFLHGLLANMQEKTFSVYPEVCPVIFSVRGGFLNIAKRARELTELEFEQEIQYTYPNTPDGNIIFKDADYYIEAEGKPSSFGWLDGKIVVIDYGN
jgi:hypothetical protein